LLWQAARCPGVIANGCLFGEGLIFQNACGDSDLLKVGPNSSIPFIGFAGALGRQVSRGAAKPNDLESHILMNETFDNEAALREARSRLPFEQLFAEMYCFPWRYIILQPSATLETAFSGIWRSHTSPSGQHAIFICHELH
jgi:hypothetical protein